MEYEGVCCAIIKPRGIHHEYKRCTRKAKHESQGLQWCGVHLPTRLEELRCHGLDEARMNRYEEPYGW